MVDHSIDTTPAGKQANMHAGRKIGWVSAAAVVVANMIGTGVFTSLGLQLQAHTNTWVILSQWAICGLAALFGAFSYAELGTRFPHSGGEYHFLTKIFHPVMGYLSGWVSLTVGFAAAIAMSAMATGLYLGVFAGISGHYIAIAAIVFISTAHSFTVRQSSRFQNALTLLKLGLVIFLILFGLGKASPDNSVDWSTTWQSDFSGPAYAISLFYVMYAFSGWNAAAYIVDEIKSPRKNLPLALISGTVVVSILFILLQLSFLRQSPLYLIQNKVEVGQIAAESMFGPQIGKVISLLIAGLLIAGISAMIWVGPRVTRAMAGEHRIWQFFARDNKEGVPVRAIWLQTIISIFMVVTSSFEDVLIYSSFVLQLFTTLTVAGLLWARWKNLGVKTAYRSPLFPFAQLFFLAFSIWMMVFLLQERPKESLLGLTNLVAGAGSYWLNRRGG